MFKLAFVGSFLRTNGCLFENSFSLGLCAIGCLMLPCLYQSSLIFVYFNMVNCLKINNHRFKFNNSILFWIGSI